MTWVKICGIKSIEEALAAKSCGAWAIGEVFAPSSRYIDVEKAAVINKELGEENILKIGVFVNENPSAVQYIAKYSGLDMVQLHGDEPPEYVGELTVPVIKSFKVDEKLEVNHIKKWRVWAYLFDSKVSGIHGGSGRTFNWELIKHLTGNERIILAGGLNSQNILTAIKTVRPMAVDVSTGVEFSQGGKDPLKIKDFMQRVKEADRYVSYQ